MIGKYLTSIITTVKSLKSLILREGTRFKKWLWGKILVENLFKCLDKYCFRYIEEHYMKNLDSSTIQTKYIKDFVKKFRISPMSPL